MTAGVERRGGTAAEGRPAADDNARAQRRDDPGAHGSAAGVLADRMAAALVHREPGWKLPRRSALARRFNVSLAEIDVAVEELSRRSLLRKLPDGQLYRASPAEYRIPIEGIGGLKTRVDPMGSAIVCRARHVSRRRAPQDIGWALGLAPGAQVRVVRCLWTSGGTPAAMSTAYLRQPAGAGEPAPGDLAPDEGPAAWPGDGEADWMPAFDTVLTAPPGEQDGPGTAGAQVPGGQPAALNVEMRPPQSSVARGLHLSPGEPAITVTIRFDESSVPVALTVVMLRPDFFKVSVETALPRAT
jgi:DNA-binding GntR family transcriptional regulator